MKATFVQAGISHESGYKKKVCEWILFFIYSIQFNVSIFINLKNPGRAGVWPSFQIWKRTQHQLTVGHRVTKCYGTSAISAEVLTAQWTLFCQLQCDTVLVKFWEVLRILQPEMAVLQKMVSGAGFHLFDLLLLFQDKS